MLENWVLHLERVGLSGHFILFAADNTILQFAQSKWPGQAIRLDLNGQFNDEENVDVKKEVDINSAGFFSVASHRAVYIHHLLSFGFSVLYSDIDIAFLHNPLPFFQTTSPATDAAASASASASASSPAPAAVAAAAADVVADISSLNFDMLVSIDRYRETRDMASYE
ncbi:unnamed protein product [Closterium sp. NIES-53]